jgi:hypothetical protein
MKQPEEKSEEGLFQVSHLYILRRSWLGWSDISTCPAHPAGEGILLVCFIARANQDEAENYARL